MPRIFSLGVMTIIWIYLHKRVPNAFPNTVFFIDIFKYLFLELGKSLVTCTVAYFRYKWV